jgi:secreted PhoX family phosphatase
VYLTEDHRNLSGLYRYVPFERSGRTGSLERGGQLQSARVKGIPNADLNVAYVGQMFELEWVSIADPDADPGAYSDATVTDTASGPFLQARNQGCLRMARGEGLWHHAGKLFIVDTATGRDIIGRRGRGQGALWILDLGTMRLSAHFVSDHWSAASHPDNVTVSPRGAVVLTEDCDGAKQQLRSGERLVAMTPDGQCYPFCRNNVTLTADDVAAAGKSVQPGDYRGREFTGVCFDSSGQFMFVNIQTPGITLAIWGPWERGNL